MPSYMILKCPTCNDGYLPSGARCGWCGGKGKVVDGGASAAGGFMSAAPLQIGGYFCVANVPPDQLEKLGTGRKVEIQ